MNWIGGTCECWVEEQSHLETHAGALLLMALKARVCGLHFILSSSVRA